MQRVRIGLTGLGFVFVAVLLATALTNGPESEQQVSNGIGPAQSSQSGPQEPLAELGVTPGHADANDSAPAQPKQTQRAYR